MATLDNTYKPHRIGKAGDEVFSMRFKCHLLVETCLWHVMGANHRADAKYCNHTVRAVIVSVPPSCFVVISVIVQILDCMPCEGVQGGD